MLKTIEIIATQLLKAIEDGLFNDIWYFIKDFNNYKLQFMLEYNQEDYDQKENIILGELNPDGFRDISGNYHWLKFNNKVERADNLKIIPTKFETRLLEREKENIPKGSSSFYKNDNTFIFPSAEAYSFELQPKQFHIEERAFSTTLAFDLLYKIEEAVTYYMVMNTKLREFVFDLSSFTYENDPRFDSYLGFFSNITDREGNVLLNWFFGFDCDEFDSIIKPIQFDVIKKAYEVIGVKLKTSGDILSLPKTLLDDLYEIERDEESNVGRGIIFREYHRIIERFGNFIYNELYDQIHLACLSIPKEYHSTLGVDDMLQKKENYRIMKLYQLSKLLKFLSNRYVSILDKKMKDEIREKHIPIVDTFSGFSNLRNIQTHDRLPIDENVLNSGIIALKSVIRSVHKIVNEVSKK